MVSRFSIPISQLLISFLSDYNFAPDGQECIPVGPDAIPAGSCLREGDKFSGSSGYRLIPGNTCDVRTGIKKDASVMKDCKAGSATPGLVSHQTVSRSFVPLAIR